MGRILPLVILVLCYCTALVVSDSIEELSAEKDETTCYDDEDNPYIQFASKTAYRVNQNKDSDEIKPKGVSSFWSLYSISIFVKQAVLLWINQVVWPSNSGYCPDMAPGILELKI